MKSIYRFIVGAILGFLTGTIVWTSGWHKGFDSGYGMAMSDAFLNLRSPDQYFKDMVEEGKKNATRRGVSH